MDDQQLAGRLESLGMKVFVKYYDRLSSPMVDEDDIVEELKAVAELEEPASRIRVKNGIAIIRAGRGPDALRMVVDSKSPHVSHEIKSAAMELLNRLEPPSDETGRS